MSSSERVLTILTNQEPNRLPLDLGSAQGIETQRAASTRLRDAPCLPPVVPPNGTVPAEGSYAYLEAIGETGFAAQVRGFISAIHNDPSPLTNNHEGRRDLKAVLAIHEAAGLSNELMDGRSSQ